MIAKKKREDKILNFKSRNIYIYMYHRQYRQFCTKRASFYFFFSLNRIIHNISTTSIPLFQTSIANSFHRHHFSLHKRNFLPTKRPSIVLCKFISCKFPNIYISQRRSQIISSPSPFSAIKISTHLQFPRANF